VFAGDDTMSENELHDLLDKFHKQIEQTPTIDQEDREKLRDLESDIRALLVRSQDQPIETEPSILNRMEVFIGTFEVTHPKLAMTMYDVIAILSNAGL
jgi:hypothetical protein